MKLHEFTDRLYAMGGIEQEEKRSRRLNEDINSDERLNQIRKELLTLDSSFEIIEDEDWGWIYNDDWVYGDITYVQITYPISDYGMKAFPQNFNVQVVDGDPINSLDRGFDNLSDAIAYAPIQFKKYFLNESLTEARNPENDEVNAAIRRYLDSDKAYIPKKDRDLFDKYGITPDKFPRSLGSRKYIQGSNGDVIGQDLPLNVHPDYDFANAVTKQKLDKGDKEYTTKDWMKWVDPYGDSPVSDNDESRMSSNQFDSLQPYWQEKTAIKDAGRRRKRALQDEEERIQSIKDDTQRTLKYIDDDKARFIKSAKKKAAERKNESLNLNESKQGLVDYFNELMSTFGVKPYEQVDYLLGYMSESELSDAIDDFKEYMDVDDSELEEAIDFAKDDLKQDFLELCKEHNLDKDTAIEALLSMLGKHAMKVLMLNLKKHFNK